MRLASRRARRKGNAVIETAFIFVVFASLVIGVFDFGQFLFVHQALVERARYALRWGVANGPGNTEGIRNIVLYDQSTAPEGATTGYFGLTSSNVVVTRTDVGTNDQRLTVQIINFPYKMLSPFITGSYTGPEIRVSYALGMYN
jgi:Flp pilus assembly protein TadG